MLQDLFRRFDRRWLLVSLAISGLVVVGMARVRESRRAR
jgi:hypothetical protein